MGSLERRSSRSLRKLPVGVRADLLRVLTSSARVRADVIRQMYARDDTRDLAEVLMDLGTDDLLRAQVVQLLARIG
jgi:hypothetical protein